MLILGQIEGGDDLSARSLLLIDADPGVQGYLAGILQRDDRDILKVPGSREAIDAIREKQSNFRSTNYT